MENVNNIRKELKTLTNRRSDLELERQKAVSKFESQKQAVISGKSEISTVQNAAAELIGFDETIAEINARIEALRSDLETLQAIEEREAVLTKIVRLDIDAEAQTKRLLALFSEFDTFMAKWREKASQVNNELTEKQNLFRDLFNELVPNVQSALRQDLPEVEKGIETTLEELKRRGARLSALQSEVFNSWHQHRLQDLTGGFRLPETKYSYVLVQLLRDSKGK